MPPISQPSHIRRWMWPALAVALLILSLAPRTAPAQAVAPGATSGAWQFVSLPAGISAASVADIAVHPSNATRLFLATASGIYSSTDAGQTWAQSTRTPSIGGVVATNDDARLYAWGAVTFLRSDNGGTDWVAVAPPPARCGLSVAPDNASRLYVRACASDGGPRFYRSDDGGATWLTPTATFTPTLTSLLALPGGTLLGTDGIQAYRSTNSGTTWAIAPTGSALTGASLAADPLGTIYLASPAGLLRSLDGGATWENSDVARPITPTLALPNGVLIAQDTSGAIQLTSTGASWAITPADMLSGTRLLAQSARDPKWLYALSDSGLWRRTLAARRIYLPLIRADASRAAASGVPSDQAIAYLNQIRALAGAPPLQSHPSLVQAAQHHADYYLLNAGDSSAWAYGFHGEVEGKPGFTGKSPGDRATVVQYPWSAGWETMIFLDNPIWAVDGWIQGPLHRAIVLDSSLRYAGYAHGKVGWTAVDVMDFGLGPVNHGIWTSALPYTIVYPAEGQVAVPIWGGLDSPSQVLSNADIIGFPTSMQLGRGTSLVVTTAELQDSLGQPTATYPNASTCGKGCYAIIPNRPLEPSTTYIAHVAGAADGIPFDRRWSFTTASCQQLDTC